jgi:multicomponent Na+:H+ antiporter subunit D
MHDTWLIAAALAAPMAGALGVVAAARRPNLREAISLASAALTFGLLASLLPGVLAGARPELALFEILPGVMLTFRVEPLGLGFGLLASSLWFVTVGYSIGYLRAHGERHQTRFFTFFALAIAATVGAALAENLLTLYVFYEALTLATYPLVTHSGGARDVAGGRTYLRVLLSTSLTLLLLALAWTYALTGTLSFVDDGVFRTDGALAAGVTPLVLTVLYALFLFGTAKAALMPFHRWLPAAMVAPTPVSALLHAVAVVKLGVFAILKVTVYTFGLDTLTEAGAGQIMQWVAAATLLGGAVLAIREDNLKRRLAFSTVSQLAYVVLAATLANEVAVLAGGMHIAAHAFAKITLFFCAGMILVVLHKSTVTELRGSGHAMPLTFAAWIVASLCVIGLPLTGGFWSKWYLARGTLEAGEPLLLAVVLLGSLLAMGYLLPPAVRAFYAPLSGTRMPAARVGLEAPWPSLVALIVTATASVALFFGAPAVFGLIAGFAQ